METIIIVNDINDWFCEIKDIIVVTANEYLTNNHYLENKELRVYNFCRSYKYQSLGYYVSLLAEARGHRILPDVTTIEDFKSPSNVRIISDDIDALIQSNLKKIKSDKFVLSIYFGKNTAQQYNALCKQLFNLFKAPLLRVTFTLNKKWFIQSIKPINLVDVPAQHQEYFSQFAGEYFSKRRVHYHRKRTSIYDMAILVNEQEKTPPSNEKALQKFIKAGERLRFNVDLITKDDAPHIAEYDALFIRETTAVNHHTYRLARRAQAEGLFVIDDPVSILKCSNKVYLNELLNKAQIPTPKSFVIQAANFTAIGELLGFPCVIKLPDSSFSQGVVKVENEHELQKSVQNFLNVSDLLIAQEFIPTEFDWRIGILGKQPLFASKYFMAANHWQVYNWNEKKPLAVNKEDFETVHVNQVPGKVMQTALRAGKAIGDGFYGVDLKQRGEQVTVIEVNDNPNIDYGVEDVLLKERLYDTIMHYFLLKIEEKKYSFS